MDWVHIQTSVLCQCWVNFLSVAWHHYLLSDNASWESLMWDALDQKRFGLWLLAAGGGCSHAGCEGSWGREPKSIPAGHFYVIYTFYTWLMVCNFYCSRLLIVTCHLKAVVRFSNYEVMFTFRKFQIWRPFAFQIWGPVYMCLMTCIVKGWLDNSK